MTDFEYNLYIENYLNNDKTKSAIMLTAPWGMGKSYYIQNCLIPYLEKSKHKKCVVVSLYGLNDIKDISKAIYLEIRAKIKSLKKEKAQAGKIVGKTIIKGALSVAGIDLSLKEADLEKLYASIDLKDKLIILEDLERSGITIKQVLGYVNNLVEQDGAKVLLVANENEIKISEKIVTQDKNGKETSKWVYTSETAEYLKIKEKTVSDTILYLCDYDEAIESILKLYSNSKLKPLLETKNKSGGLTIASDIRGIMTQLHDHNLRSLIFARQKTADIFSNYTYDLNTEFLRHVFLGNVAFSLRLKENDELRWSENATPNELGTSKYPLYEFCKEYIEYQELDIEEIKSAQVDFIERKEYEKKQRETNAALTSLYDFPRQKETILTLAVESIRDELKEGNRIPLVEYGKLANYLIIVKKLINNPNVIDECKVLMIENIKNDTKINTRLLDRLKIHDSFNMWEEEQKEEYNQLIQEMSAAFHENSFPQLAYEEPMPYLEEISKLMFDRESDIRQGKSFLKKINIDKLVQGLEKATAEQVSNFRRGVLSTYDIGNIRDFLPDDKDSLIELRNAVQKLLDDSVGADKIVRLQYSWLVSNLDKAIENY